MKIRAVALLAALAARPASAGWNQNGYWDDGQAEVAVYEAERFADGTLRRYEEIIVTMKEELRRDNLARVERPAAGQTFTVLRMNASQLFDAQNGPHRYNVSVYADESALDRAVKISVGTQEWSGNSFKLFTRRGPNQTGRLELHSFGSEPDRTVELPLKPGDYFEDQLPLSLRGLPFSAAYERPVRIVTLLATNRATLPAVLEGRLRIAGMDKVRCPAGVVPAWKVEISVRRGGSLTRELYWFDQQYPHTLVRMEASDGRRLLLRGRARWAYWDPNAPRPAELN